MKKYTTLTILFIAVLTFLKFESSNSSDDLNYISGKAFVVDGDTVKVNGKKIRLLNIDSAESKQKCFNTSNQRYFCGKAATKFLIELIGGKIISCEYQKLDIYNRILGTCFLNKININLEMIKSGHAIIYSYKNSSEDYIEAEEYAKKRNAGLWQGHFEIPKDFRKRNRGKKK